MGARRLKRDVCRRCVICRRVTARAEQQQMGQLSSARVIPSPIFSKTGMDFAGSFLLKHSHVRKLTLVKNYICICVCFSTKATQIEVVSDLSTEAFLVALKRFTARRGLPSECIRWNFSPECAPHFGGLWEAAMKSAKLHLRRVIGQQFLDYEEFSTLLCQIKTGLNRLPLIPLSSHSDDGSRL